MSLVFFLLVVVYTTYDVQFQVIDSVTLDVCLATREGGDFILYHIFVKIFVNLCENENIMSLAI